jgi:hypothetical protein
MSRPGGVRIMRGLSGVLLGVLLSACAGQEPLPVTCNEAQMICYRGYVIDSAATRDRFGIPGLIRIKQDAM